MNNFTPFLNAIASAATSPLALVAYLAAIAAWAFVAARVLPLRTLMKDIKDLPESDRLDAILATTGRPVPPDLTGEEYLRMQIHYYLFVGFLSICAVIIVVTGMGVWRYFEQRARADAYTREILAAPASSYMSAVNTLSNGRGMIVEAASSIGPQMSMDDINAFTEKMVRQHKSGEEIASALGETAGAGRFNRVNNTLRAAAATLNESYKKLAECFRSVECRAGDEFDHMCSAVASIFNNIQRANDNARRVPGVNFNDSGTKSVLNDGTMDLNFIAISAPNVEFLAIDVCRGRVSARQTS